MTVRKLVKNKSANEKPIASVSGETMTAFEFKGSEWQNILMHLNILKNFGDPEFDLINLRKIFKNSKIIGILNDSFDETNEAFNQQEVNIQRLSNDMQLKYQKKETVDPEEGIKLHDMKLALNDKRKEEEKKKHALQLYTILETEFPKDMQNKGGMDWPDSKGGTRQVRFVNSFLELIEYGIIEEAL